MAEIRRGSQRYVSRREGTTTWHSFSYGDHYDSSNLRLGPLQAVNEELVEPGFGYSSHRHEDVEIVTWVLDGALRHEDSTGNRGIVRPGQVQHVSAGRGLDHVEQNASATEPLRFVQMMLAPSDGQLASDAQCPTYDQHDVEGVRGRLLRAVLVRPGVELLVAFLDAGDDVQLPADGDLHLHLTRGAVRLGSDRLEAGDTARLRSPMSVTALIRSEMLVWHLRTDPDGAP